MAKDTCVACGVQTPYEEGLHVDLRFHYVEGAGQLCEQCHDKTYNS